MNEEQLATIRACLVEVLRLSEADAASITEATTAAQVAQWTSAAHVELVFAVERAFDVMFEADEIAELASVSAIAAAVARHRSR